MEVTFAAIIPTYNRERTLARAIRSAVEQTHPPAEILVVDDGSTDQTRHLVAAFGDKVRYIYQDNAGTAAARNAGVAAARCDWLAFLDSDDYWLPHHLGNLAAAIERTQGRAGCYFSDALLTKDGAGEQTWWALCGFHCSDRHSLKVDASEWGFLPVQPMLLPASAIGRKVFLEAGGLHRSMRTREDTLLFHKLSLQYPMCAVAGCGMVVTDDGANRLTRVFDRDHAVYWASTILMYKELLSGVGFREAAQKRVIECRLSDAHTGIAITSLRTGDYRKATLNALAAAWASPVHFVATIASRAARKWRARSERRG